MAGWVASMIWVGGMGVAYRSSRTAGNSAIGAIFDASLWPFALGHVLATWADRYGDRP